MLDNLTGLVNSALSEVASAFSQVYGGKKVSLRYPLGDTDKFQNMIKFTALSRQQKNNKVDKFVVAPEFAASTLGAVSLYMPAGLQVNDNLSYDNVDTGIGGMLVNTYQNAASSSEFLKQVAADSPQLGDRFISQKLAEASQNKGIVGGAAGQVLINRGEVINPHTQMLFRSPALRQFNFNFKLIPRSKAEAKEIIKIVQFFRLAAYPSLGPGASEAGAKGANAKQLSMAAYTFPDVFEIKYMTGSRQNTNLIKYGRAYLTSINVNYNATSPTFYEDGMPSEIDLALTFQETKAISREDIKNGY
jgi:hypothetical protein